MKIKTIEFEGKEYAEISNGKPIYVDDDGKEKTYDPIAMHSSIGRLNAESKGHREAKEAAEAALKAFGDLDPKKAKEAMETVANIDGKKLIDAGEVDKLRKEITDGFQAKLDESKQENEKLRSAHERDKLNTAFLGSKYIKEKLAVPADMVQGTFGRHFVFKDGNINPVDANGNPIYSDSNPGEVATFDEALEKIVNQYPNRDTILKGTGHTGSGATPPGEGGQRTISRKEFENASAHDQQRLASSPEVRIVD